MHRTCDVFVSYCEDTADSYVEHIGRILGKRRNCNVFVAHLERANHSYNFEKYVNEAIESCNIFILVLTMDVFESTQVIREVKHIIEREICEGCLWIFRYDDPHVPRSEASFIEKTKLDPNINQHDFKVRAELSNLLLIQFDESREICCGQTDIKRRKLSPYYRPTMSFDMKDKQLTYGFTHFATWKDEDLFKFHYVEGIDIDSNGYIYAADEGNHVRKFDMSGKLIKEWGSEGIKDGEFRVAYALTIDSHDCIYVSDESGRIQKFDSQGNFIMKWGSEGTENGEFSSPFGMAVDKYDNVYVSEETNDRIQKFDSQGNFIMKWGSEGTENGQFNDPMGIAIDSVGNVYVADYLNHRIQKFDCTGNFIMKWGKAGKEAGCFDHPHGITVDSLDLIYVSDSMNGRVQIFTSNGILLTILGKSGAADGELNVPRDLVLDSSRRLIVSDGSNHRIQVFVPTDKFKEIHFAAENEITFYYEKVKTSNDASKDASWEDLEQLASKVYIWNDERVWSLISEEVFQDIPSKHSYQALVLLKRMLNEVKSKNPNIDGVAMKAKTLYLEKLKEILEDSHWEKEKLFSKQIIDLITEERERFLIYWSVWKNFAKKKVDEDKFTKLIRYFINDLEDTIPQYQETIREELYELINSPEEYISSRADTLRKRMH